MHIIKKNTYNLKKIEKEKLEKFGGRGPRLLLESSATEVAYLF